MAVHDTSLDQRCLRLPRSEICGGVFCFPCLGSEQSFSIGLADVPSLLSCQIRLSRSRVGDVALGWRCRPEPLLLMAPVVKSSSRCQGMAETRGKCCAHLCRLTGWMPPRSKSGSVREFHDVMNTDTPQLETRVVGGG